MINWLLRLTAGLTLTGALVMLGMAWGRYVAPSTSVDTRAALTGSVLVGALLIFPIVGLLRSRPR